MTPLWVDTEHLFEFPEPYRKLLLPIYFTYGNVSFHVTLSIISPFPPLTPCHLSGSSPCTSPKHSVSCIKHRLALRFYMIVYMFQCHSPKSSHPLPVPQSPKDCSIHLCLFCCLAYRVIVTIFLNSIYMH